MSEKLRFLSTEMIPVEKAEIAPENMSFKEIYEGDEGFRRNLEQVGLLQDVVGRWEGDRFLIILGAKRFHELKALGVKEFPAKATDLKGYEALLASLSENIFRTTNPISRAKQLRRMADLHPRGLAGVAEQIGRRRQTVSEWVKVLELDESLQKLLVDGVLPFYDALQITRKVPQPQQPLIAEMVEKHGSSFLNEAMREAGVERRGAKKGTLAIRFTFTEEEKKLHDFAVKKATSLGVKPGDYVKGIVLDALKREMRKG